MGRGDVAKLSGDMQRENAALAILITLEEPSRPMLNDTGEYERVRRQAAHRALVILCKGARPGMGLLNAECFRNPYGAPAIHIASEARETVLAAAARAAEARVVADSRHAPATARNVVVTIRGRHRSFSSAAAASYAGSKH